MSVSFEGLSPKEAVEFTDRWLPAWTGNDPDRLVSFYSDDVFYSDPAVPDGIEGKEALRRYFRALLSHFPDWEWRHVDAIPMQGGFLNIWHATIPVAGRILQVEGVCTVELRDGLISSNRVYFDRSELLAALAEVEVAPNSRRGVGETAVRVVLRDGTGPRLVADMSRTTASSS